MQFINEDLLKREKEHTIEFGENSPFPNILFNDFIKSDKLMELEQAFPDDPNWEGWNNSDHAHQRNKYSCQNIHSMPEQIRQLLFELSTPAVCKYLSEISGEKVIIPDPFLKGGGLHMTTEGGYLTPHIDFHYYKELNLYRRINLLIYLNDEWDPSMKGEFELWDKSSNQIVKTIPPVLGNTAIFLTNAVSLHGFSQPIEGFRRKSIAVYYYSTIKPKEFSGDTNTYWAPHQGQTKNGTMKAFNIVAQRALLGAAKVTSSWTFLLENTASVFRGK